ncbi:STAS domain-containing protein [Streptomyces sp. NPDC006477]|uniref:STAS domain-containing protein n=1 Tax=Streptomyces sp. NPDC006477 TaxID=3364747 RepID=UPI003692412E
MPGNEADPSALLSGPGPSAEPLPVLASVDAAQECTVIRYEALGTQVVAALGAFDINCIGLLAKALEAAAETHPKVILDASGVTFADSAFLNLMILTHRTGKLLVAAPSKQVQRLCAITGVDNVLQFRETVDAAMTS